jgi:hypothetical protein
MYQDGELIIDPEFQRMFRWTEGAQSRFIESLLLELPVPPIFLIEREDRIYELIDGLQRISSYLHFRGILRVDDELRTPLRLSDCDIVTELNGLAQADLPRSLDIKLKRSYIRAEILRKESDPRLRYYMFKRLNTGGERLSEQEVRNATIRLLSAEFNDFLIELSRNPDFVETTGSVSESARLRRFDQELVLRFFAFKNALADYRHDVSDFLTDYMEAVSDPSAPSDELRSVSFDYAAERATFEKTFRVLNLIASETGLGARVFGSVTPNNRVARGQFSVYHYEALTLGMQSVLDRVNPDDREQIQRLAAVVDEGKVEPDFIKHTGAGKNDPNPLRARIQFFAERFQAVV